MKSKLIGLAVTVFGLTVGAVLLQASTPSRPAPSQPIAFSHAIHAGQNQIPCLYCHAYATRSPVAGVPAVERCMNCHQYVATDAPEVQKLQKYWDDKKPIQWVRVYNLPDFVRFTHEMHIKAGLTCQTCHGEVEKMDRVFQVSSLEMGWCVSCHTARGASKDCATCHK